MHLSSIQHQLTILASILLLAGCNRAPNQEAGAPPVLRIGFFPNITHAQGLIGYQETTTKGSDGWFEKATGAKIEWLPFNAGPSAIEALLAGSIDATYVGPSPALNGYTRTATADIRVLTGAARGGSALLIRKGSGLKTPADFRGKKIATPQLGNTQDIAARAWLASGGLKITPGGGDAFVIPTQNPDQLDLLKRGELDAAWTVEPWVSRLEMESDAEVLLQQDDSLATVLATGTRALTTKRELLQKLLVAHEALTTKIAAEPEWAKPLVASAIGKLTTKPIPQPLLERAWPRLRFSTDLQAADFTDFQRDARAAGLLNETADLAKLITRP